MYRKKSSVRFSSQLRSFSWNTAPSGPRLCPNLYYTVLLAIIFSSAIVLENVQPSYPAHGQTFLFPTTEDRAIRIIFADPTSSSGSSSLAAPISNITNLYNALLKAGVVSATGTPTGAGETAKDEGSKLEPIDVVKVIARECRKAILFCRSSLPAPELRSTSFFLSPMTHSFMSCVS